ncbi:MAG: universal stress protein [Bacteroidia bacterium]
MKNILVATDFSENAKHALQYAVTIARNIGGRITLIHEYEPGKNEDSSLFTLPADNEKCLDEKRKNLNKLAEEIIPSNIEFDCVSYSGNAIQSIPRFAVENNYTLIVMGIRGNNRLSQLIMGSTTTGVIHHSQVPVLVVPENTDIKLPASIVFAYDGKEKLTDITAGQLKEIVNAFKAKLYVLNVISDLAVKPVDEKCFDAEIYNALNSTDYSLHFTENGDVLQGIINFIDEYQIDAVAMIYHPKSFFSSLFTGNRTNRMAFYTHKPLFVLPGVKYISGI